MRIVAKELDKYISTQHKNKVVSEFIVYLMIDEIPVEAHVEFGDFAKNKRIKSISNRHPVLEITNQYLTT